MESSGFCGPVLRDPLDARLAEKRNVELITLRRSGRYKSPSQDGHPLRHYQRRWKMERLFAWLQNLRRLVVCYEYRLNNFLTMIQLGGILILTTYEGFWDDLW